MRREIKRFQINSNSIAIFLLVGSAQWWTSLLQGADIDPNESKI